MKERFKVKVTSPDVEHGFLNAQVVPDHEHGAQHGEDWSVNCGCCLTCYGDCEDGCEPALMLACCREAVKVLTINHEP
jgi:hypothetical protein